jgi:hypothetical protein
MRPRAASATAVRGSICMRPDRTVGGSWSRNAITARLPNLSSRDGRRCWGGAGPDSLGRRGSGCGAGGRSGSGCGSGGRSGAGWPNASGGPSGVRSKSSADEGWLRASLSRRWSPARRLRAGSNEGSGLGDRRLGSEAGDMFATLGGWRLDG